MIEFFIVWIIFFFLCYLSFRQACRKKLKRSGRFWVRNWTLLARKGMFTFIYISHIGCFLFFCYILEWLCYIFVISWNGYGFGRGCRGCFNNLSGEWMLSNVWFRFQWRTGSVADSAVPFDCWWCQPAVCVPDTGHEFPAKLPRRGASDWVEEPARAGRWLPGQCSEWVPWEVCQLCRMPCHLRNHRGMKPMKQTTWINKTWTNHAFAIHSCSGNVWRIGESLMKHVPCVPCN